MKPYLIQRAKFCNNPHRKGIDSILAFDYMGSAEFKFEVLPQSLKRIREKMSDYHTFSAVGTSLSHPSNPSNKFKITIFCDGKNYEIVCKIIENLADNKFRLKEYCDFSDWIHGKTNHRSSDLWWDIENDYMFWVFNPEFTTAFEKLIKPESI